MVKHIVFWKIKPELDKQATMEQMRQRLEALVGKVPGLISAEVGFNYNPAGFDIALYSILESKEALDGYQIHPEHVKVKEFVHTVVCDRAVVDYEI